MLHEFHPRLGATFLSVNGAEVVADYGSVLAEHQALGETVGALDLGFRGRLCLTGPDRAGFLHGQVTNEIKGLRPGEGCYAALITAKGRMQSDLNIYRLDDEFLLDFEPGLTKTVSERLEKYIISEDVQVVDVGALYGLVSVQGPKAEIALRAAEYSGSLPAKPFSFVKANKGEGNDWYVMNQPRFGSSGFDVFLPAPEVSAFLEKLLVAVQAIGGRFCGWTASEIARIEAGIPRFGADMDETTIPLEAGLESRAISFKKGCYIGQEVISRIKTYGQVAKALRGIQFEGHENTLPVKGD